LPTCFRHYAFSCCIFWTQTLFSHCLLICSDPGTGASAALALAQPLVQAVTMAPATSHPAQELAAASRVTSQELLSTRRRRQALAQALAQAATQALEQAQAMTVATQDLGLATIWGLETLGLGLATTWAEMLLQVSVLPCCSPELQRCFCNI